MISGPLLDVLLRTMARKDLEHVRRPFGVDGLIVAACGEGVFAVPGETEPPSEEMAKIAAVIGKVLRHPFRASARVELSKVRSWMGFHQRCEECWDTGTGLCPWCQWPRSAECEACERTGVRVCPCKTRDLPEGARFFGFPVDRSVLRRLTPEVDGEIVVSRNPGAGFIRIQGDGWESYVMGCRAVSRRAPASFGESL